MNVKILPDDKLSAIGPSNLGRGVCRDRRPGRGYSSRGKIFDRFYLADNSRSREAAGVALGLAIAKWTVQAHAGELSVDDDIDGGCAFRTLKEEKQIREPNWRDKALLRGTEVST